MQPFVCLVASQYEIVAIQGLLYFCIKPLQLLATLFLLLATRSEVGQLLYARNVRGEHRCLLQYVQCRRKAARRNSVSGLIQKTLHLFQFVLLRSLTGDDDVQGLRFAIIAIEEKCFRHSFLSFFEVTGVMG